MKYAFGGGSSFNGDVEQWNVENVGNFENMFEDASSFERNISVWDIGSGSVTTSMFDGDVGLSDCVRESIYDIWSGRGVEISSFANAECESPTTLSPETTTLASTVTAVEVQQYNIKLARNHKPEQASNTCNKQNSFLFRSVIVYTIY